jgi:hypothetical protein
MPIKLTLDINNASDLMGTAAYGTAAKAVVERGTAVDDVAFAPIGTALLVDGQNQYEVWDSTGSSDYYYRFRVENEASSLASAYSDVFRGTAATTYASLDDLVERLNLPDETRFNLLNDLLGAVSSQFDNEAGRQFYRIPQVDGTTVRLYDGNGGLTLRIPEGCVSLTTVEVATGTGGSYATLGTTEWRLRPAHPAPDWPYTELVLTDLATTTFTPGYDTVRLTGVFGWASVPQLVTEAVLQLAQRSYNQSQTADAGQIGVGDLGTMTLSSQRPDAWYRALRAFGRRPGIAL